VIRDRPTKRPVARSSATGPSANSAGPKPSSATRCKSVERILLTPAAVLQLHAALQDRGVALVDAPVAGSRPQAWVQKTPWPWPKWLRPWLAAIGPLVGPPLAHPSTASGVASNV
jgi:hypothetical protein